MLNGRGGTNKHKEDSSNRYLKVFSVFFCWATFFLVTEGCKLLPVGSLAWWDWRAGLKRVGGKRTGAEAAVGAAQWAHSLHRQTGVSASLTHTLLFAPEETFLDFFLSLKQPNLEVVSCIMQGLSQNVVREADMFSLISRVSLNELIFLIILTHSDGTSVVVPPHPHPLHLSDHCGCW